MWILKKYVWSRRTTRYDDDDDGAREHTAVGAAATVRHGRSLRSALRVRASTRPLLGSRRGACDCEHPSRPGRAAIPGWEKPAAGGRGRYRSTEREPVTVCRHNLGGRPGRVPGRTANLTLARRGPGPLVCGPGARAAPSVWPSIRYTTLRQAWPGTRGSPRPQCAFDWSMFV